MILIITLWSENLTLDYYLLTQIACVMNFMKKSIKKIYKHKELFDLSNYPKNSRYYCSGKKNVLGKMKDEYGGKLIFKFVGLKSKMYSILDENNNEKSTNKEHNAFIEFKEFQDTLFEKRDS